MAFPVGWSRRAKLTIQQSQIPGSGALANFPLLVTHASLPSEMLDADGGDAAQNGGGDIRFSADAAGATQLACEIVTFATHNNPASALAEIWVSVASVSKTADTEIYVWWRPASTESQPAVTDTFGRNAVWSAYGGVWHGDSTTDSTGNGNTLSPLGNTSPSVNHATAKVGRAMHFPGSGPGPGFGSRFNAGSGSTLDHGSNGGHSVQCWLRATSGGCAMWKGGYGAGWQTLVFIGDALYWTANNNREVSHTGGYSSGSWYCYHLVWTGADSYASMSIYRNGALQAKGYQGDGGPPASDAAASLYFGANRDGADAFVGQLDEVRITKTLQLSADQVAAEHAMMDAPASFVFASAMQTIGGGERFFAALIG